MFDYFIALLFGHLVGDYLFQNDWMALNKKKAWKPLVVHCLDYTFWVVLFLLLTTPYGKLSDSYQLLGALGIFLSHIVLDGTRILETWMRWSGGRTFKIINPGSKIMCTEDSAVYFAYTALVTTVADNTLHMIMMYYWIKWLVNI